MCGRYVSTSPPSELAARFAVDEVRADDRPPDYNVTPRSEVAIVAETAEHRRVLDRVRWGLVPSWARDLSIGDRLVNARAESLGDKPAYRRAFARRRCLIPADGFYEWRPVPGRRAKQPYFVHAHDHRPLAFAGLWEVWRDHDDPDAAWIRSCVIVTTEANEKLAPVHDRMPVVLAEGAWGEWLDPDGHDVEALARLLVPAPVDELDLYPVRTLVNRPQHNGPELVEPAPVDELPEGIAPAR